MTEKYIVQKDYIKKTIKNDSEDFKDLESSYIPILCRLIKAINSNLGNPNV